MAPRRKDLDVWVGNTWRKRFRMSKNGIPTDLTGSKFVLRAVWGNTTMRKASDVDTTSISITDPDADPPIVATDGILTIWFTIAQTRQWVDGDVIRYEVERWIGAEQKTMFYGELKATAWVNDDVDP